MWWRLWWWWFSGSGSVVVQWWLRGARPGAGPLSYRCSNPTTSTTLTPPPPGHETKYCKPGALHHRLHYISGAKFDETYISLGSSRRTIMNNTKQKTVRFETMATSTRMLVDIDIDRNSLVLFCEGSRGPGGGALAPHHRWQEGRGQHSTVADRKGPCGPEHESVRGSKMGSQCKHNRQNICAGPPCKPDSSKPSCCELGPASIIRGHTCKHTTNPCTLAAGKDEKLLFLLAHVGAEKCQIKHDKEAPD